MSALAASAQQAKQIQKVYSEWSVKAAEIILASRIDSPGSAADRREAPTATSASFNLKVPELFAVRSEAVARPEFFQLRTQRSFQVEIYLGPASEEAGGEDAQLLERWTFTFLPANQEVNAQLDRSNQTLVRKLSVALRSLLCFVRLLPAHGICRRSRNSGSEPPPPRHFRFRVEAWPPTSRTGPGTHELLTQDFVSLQSSVGTLRLSVSQRKDLKSLTSAGLNRANAGLAFGSQIDDIEVEEGYFSQASSSTALDSSTRRLDKISEETIPTTADSIFADAQSMQSTAPYEASSARVDRSGRGRLGSEDSVGSTMSTSSRGASFCDPAAVVLGSTPPMAGIGHGSLPGPTGLSDCSSRSNTPYSTPKLGPDPEPNVDLLGTRSSTKASSAAAGQGMGQLGPGGATRSPADAQGEVAVSSVRSSQAFPSPSSGPTMAPGVLDDLSGIWMGSLPEWGRRRSMSQGGSMSRGTGSRSLSPEDASRGGAASAQFGDEQSGVPGAMARARASSIGSSYSSRRGGRPQPTFGGSEGEICMFGMSDDEDDFGSDEEDLSERNVVASAIMEGGGGGAFATSSRPLDPSRLGLAGLDFESQGPLSRSSSRRGSGVVGDPRAPSEGSQMSPRRSTPFSPLIAQLNPFQHQKMPSLDLPPSVDPGDASGGGLADEVKTSSALAATEAADLDKGEPDVQLLLEEMGDLVCRLQQRQELALVRQEASPEDLLRRLEHFREVAEQLAGRVRSN